MFLCKTALVVICVSLLSLAHGQSGQRIQHTRQIGTSDNSSMLTGVVGLYANPAAATDQSEDWQFALSANNRFSTDIKSVSGAVNKRFGSSNLGLVVGQYGISEFNEKQVSLAFGRSIGKQSYIGIMGHYYQLQIEGLGQRGHADLSIGFWHGINKRWIISGYIKNPLEKLQDKNRVVGKAELSIALIISEKLDFYVGVDHSWQNEQALKPGIRYKPSQYLSLYASMSTSPEAISFGADINLDNGLNCSLGINTHPILGNSLSLSLGYHL